jgi:predicted phosphodiesterase
MLICFLGDIHGNRDALEAFLKHFDRLNPGRVYCLGDLVGWLPFGDRALMRLRSLGYPTVAGNHDLLVAGFFTDHPDQLDRMQATAYNAGLLSTVPEAIEYLGNLPLLIEENDFTVVHHSPFHLPEPGQAPTIDCFGYLDEATLKASLKAWRAFPKRMIFSGHDHIPAVYELSDCAGSPGLQDVKVYRPKNQEPLTIRLRSGCRYWIKAGSIGGPYRDGIAAANFAAYDSEAETVALYRLPYPVERLRRELASHFFGRNLPTLQKFVKLLDS